MQHQLAEGPEDEEREDAGDQVDDREGGPAEGSVRRHRGRARCRSRRRSRSSGAGGASTRAGSPPARAEKSFACAWSTPVSSCAVIASRYMRIDLSAAWTTDCRRSGTMVGWTSSSASYCCRVRPAGRPPWPPSSSTRCSARSDAVSARPPRSPVAPSTPPGPCCLSRRSGSRSRPRSPTAVTRPRGAVHVSHAFLVATIGAARGSRASSRSSSKPRSAPLPHRRRRQPHRPARAHPGADPAARHRRGRS